MGKTHRRRDHSYPLSGVMMSEKVEKQRPQEWHDQRKKEKKLHQKLRKLRKQRT